MCSDPAHDDLALHDEWSYEDRYCDGDGPHRDGRDDREDRDDPEDPDDLDEDEGSQEVQEALLSFSGFKNLLYTLTLFINSSEFNILYYIIKLNLFNRSYIINR